MRGMDRDPAGHGLEMKRCAPLADVDVDVMMDLILSVNSSPTNALI
jgi:hypothetical protein